MKKILLCWIIGSLSLVALYGNNISLNLPLNVDAPKEHEQFLQKQRQEKQIYNTIYNRYGREDYHLLKKYLLENITEFTHPQQIIATIQIFKEAKDFSALVKAIQQIDTVTFSQREMWQKIDRIISWVGDYEVYNAFLLQCPVSSGVIPMRASGDHLHLWKNKNITPEELIIVKKIFEFRPDSFAKYCYMLEDEQKAMQRLNSQLANEKDSSKRLILIKMLYSFVAKYRYNEKLEQFPELKEFVYLIDTNNLEELQLFIAACSDLKLYDYAIELLIKRLDLPMSKEEIAIATRFYALRLGDKEQESFAFKQRQATLIDFLIKAKKAKEAQFWAEKFYGKDFDLNAISSLSLTRIGAIQSMSGQRVFANAIKSAKPKVEENSLEYYKSALFYYKGRADKDKELELLDEALKGAEKKSSIEANIVTAWALRQKSLVYGQDWGNAIKYSRKANEYAVKNLKKSSQDNQQIANQKSQIRLEIASTLCYILEESRPLRWRNEWEDVLRTEFLAGYTFLMRYYLLKKQRENKNFTMSANDEIFKKLLSAEYQEQYGFQDAAHELRLNTVKMNPTSSAGFLECLDWAIDDFKKYNLYKQNDFPVNLGNPLYRDDEDSVIRKGWISKKIYDFDPEKYFYKFVPSVVVRSYSESKKILEKEWQNSNISAGDRIIVLQELLKKDDITNDEKEWCLSELKKLGVPLI